MRTPFFIMILATYGCGAAVEEHGSTTPSGQIPPLEVSAEAGQSQTGGEIQRGELIAVLDAGIGRFLSGVETEPAMVSGRFLGFRVISIFPNDESLSSLDLAPGDVVTRVNGHSIERPEHAFTVWSGLRVASELHIEYLRDGEDRQLRYAIVD